MALEKLNLPLVALGGFQGRERSQVAALAGLRMAFPRIKAVFACFKFLDHKVHLVVSNTKYQWLAWDDCFASHHILASNMPLRFPDGAAVRNA